MTNGAEVDPRELALDALYRKRDALERYIDLLFEREAEDPDLVTLRLGRAKIERDLNSAKIEQLEAGVAIQLPHPDTVERINRRAGKLSQLVDFNGALNEIVAAGDALLTA